MPKGSKSLKEAPSRRIGIDFNRKFLDRTDMATTGIKEAKELLGTEGRGGSSPYEDGRDPIG